MTTDPGARRMWDLDDLVAVGDIADDLGATKSQVCMWIARTRTSGFPAALTHPSCGDLYSMEQVRAWWKTYRHSTRHCGGLLAIQTKRDRGIPTSRTRAATL
jgi:hypothetical protein